MNTKNEGVWRTIGGRRVFIKDGEDLASAMKRSGKFNGLTKKQKEAAEKLNKNAENGVRSDIKDFLSGREDYEGSREDFIRDLANEWQVDQDKVEQILKEETTKSETKTTNEVEASKDWRTQVKENNANMEKKLSEWNEKRSQLQKESNSDDYVKRIKAQQEINKMEDDYYKIFRENERANAKIKQEVPNEKYEQVEAYAGYKDKFNSTWGEDGSGDAVVSAKMYTNDEFMEHLTDANWHSEAKQLIDAGLTNEELSYIKDRTNVSAWGVENLSGKQEVDQAIKEAKNRGSFTKRYDDSIKYLKANSNLSESEIIEFLKKLEK